MLTPKEAVANGVTALDRKHPNWYKQIDLKTLNMSECGYCIAGQIWGDYFKRPRYLANATHLGLASPTFMLPTWEEERKYERRLKAEWVSIIKLRLEEDPSHA